MKTQIYMKNNTFFKLFIIVIFAIAFRLWSIDKQYGLWNDEYVGWMIASESDIMTFIKKVLSNCHTPLYYFYLRIWMTFFGDSDISLRISSLVPSVVAIPIIYQAGKTLKNEYCGILAAVFTCISSFCIYFAQEVRLYSLLFLFTSIVVFYFLKTIKRVNKKNFLTFLFFNVLLCMTHTLGIIFSVCILGGFFYYLSKYDNYFDKFPAVKKKLYKDLMKFIIAAIIISPLLINIAFSKNLSQFWSEFSVTKIILNFTDYFSPIQTNMINTPDNFFVYLYKNAKFNAQFIIFAVLPLIIAITGIFQAVRQKNNALNTLLLTAALFYIILIVLSVSGKMVLSTKYSIEIYPVILLTFAYGFSCWTNSSLRNILLALYLFLNIIYLVASPSAAQKLERREGNLAPVKLIEYSRLKNGENVILTYYDVDKLQKYLSKDDKYKFSSINKFNFNYIYFHYDDYFETIKKGKYLFKNNLKTFPDRAFQDYIYKNYIYNMQKGERIGIIILDNVSFFTNSELQKIINNDKQFEKTPFIFMAFSCIKNNLMFAFKDDFVIDSITQAGDWTLIVYEKVK